LTERGRKFISLIETHYRNYKGLAFYKDKKNEVKKFHVSGRVMVDAISFREKNPNYFGQPVNARSSQDGSIDIGLYRDADSDSDDSSSGNNQEVTKRKTTYNGEDLLLCNPTVFGFCLSTKQWGQYLS
jgi:hypothetical protein